MKLSLSEVQHKTKEFSATSAKVVELREPVQASHRGIWKWQDLYRSITVNLSELYQFTNPGDVRFTVLQDGQANHNYNAQRDFK